MENIFLETPRLNLQLITPAYIHHIFETMTKAQIQTLMGFEENAYQHHLEMHENGMETHRLSLRYFLLKEKGSGRPVGECGFHTWNATHRRAELFYRLFEEASRGKGLMTEALQVVLDHGFTTMNLHRVAALVWKDNLPSLKLLEHYGFQFEGTLREDYVVDGKSEDSECYALLSWEWRKNVLPSKKM